MRWSEKDDPPQAFCRKGRKRPTRHLPRKCIPGVRDDQRPGVMRTRARFQRLFDNEPKLFGVLGVKGPGNSRRPGRRAKGC